jgi:hypothetical protein
MQIVVCPEPIDLSTGSPVCSAGWLAVESIYGFDPSMLDPGAIANAIGSGFIVATIPLAVVWGGRRLVNYFFNK